MSGMTQQGNGDILTTSQVASIFNVTPRTVTAWANAGKLKSFSTPGGHHRFNRADIVEHLSRFPGTE